MSTCTERQQGRHSPPVTRPVLAALLGLSLASAAAGAQDYPAKPVQVVVPFAAGGGVDATTRVVADVAGEILGQRLAIDNRGGGSTIIGTQAVARAEGDGYTLLAAPTTMVINPALKPKLPYDWQGDFVPVALLAKLPFVVVAGKELPAGTMGELAQLGKRSGEELTFGSGGAGTVAHLAGEVFALRSGARMVHVSYRGEGPALVDAIGGQISVMFSTLASASGHIQSGQLKPLAVTTRERASLLPDVPTVAEQGYPDYDLSAWIALVAPKGTPRPVVEKLNAAFNDALRRPELRDKLTRLGAEPAGGTPEELAAFMAKDAAIWADVVKKAGVTAE